MKETTLLCVLVETFVDTWVVVLQSSTIQLAHPLATLKTVIQQLLNAVDISGDWMFRRWNT
jgi:hypothetical protein